ncbi:CU044_5270 family protein, partial [Nonomuraea guangzhouensis]
AATTAAAVVAGVALTTHDAGRPQIEVEATPHTLSPRGMMLAAASQAELQQQGRYWYTHQRTSFSALALGRTGGYVVEERSEYFQWRGRTRGDGESFYGRDFAGKPQTRADADAWRAAGSPPSWTVRSSGVSRTVRTKSGAWQVDNPDDQGGGTFNIAGVGQFSYQELQEFPTDPGELRKLLCEGLIKLAAGRSGAPRRCDGPKGMLDQVFFVLLDTPVPPKVRAGLIRLVTDYPGVRQLGTVTDPLGRTAVGLAAPFESADGRGKIQLDVFFDQRTGNVLGSRDIQLEPGPDSKKWQVPGRMLDSWVAVDSGWKDTRPTLPD